MPLSAAFATQRKEERPRPKPEPLRVGSGALLDTLVREADDVQRDACLP